METAKLACTCGAEIVNDNIPPLMAAASHLYSNSEMHVVGIRNAGTLTDIMYRSPITGEIVRTRNAVVPE